MCAWCVRGVCVVWWSLLGGWVGAAAYLFFALGGAGGVLWRCAAYLFFVLSSMCCSVCAVVVL